MIEKIPPAVTLVEVCPRDGFQNVRTFIDTEYKKRIIRGLAASGITEIELTSFVSPKAIPQMADSAEIAAVFVDELAANCRTIALVPNLKGAQTAWDSGIRTVSYVISVSAAHNMANVRRTSEESLADLRRIKCALPDLKLRADLATAFGCPFEGAVPPGAVLRLMEKVLNCGVSEIVLCDTIGIADPVQVQALSKQARKMCGELPMALHLHDTRGMGLVNICAGIDGGISRFETSAGGLGGCPFAPGAAGNTATEDAVNMLHAIGADTGISLEALLKAVALIKQYIKPDLTSRMGNIGACEEA